MARFVRNDRLSDAVQLWAFGAINVSPGARHYYDVRRRRGQSHSQALRAVGNRLVGILHGCIEHRTPYSESVAWHPPPLRLPLLPDTTRNCPRFRSPAVIAGASRASQALLWPPFFGVLPFPGRPLALQTLSDC